MIEIAPFSNVNMSLKIKLAMVAYNVLSPEVVRNSFRQCKLWPMNYAFLDRYGKDVEIREEKEVVQKKNC